MIFFRKACNASMVRGAIVLFFNETNILDNNFISTLSSWVQRSGYGWVRSPITYMGSEGFEVWFIKIWARLRHVSGRTSLKFGLPRAV